MFTNLAIFHCDLVAPLNSRWFLRWPKWTCWAFTSDTQISSSPWVSICFNTNAGWWFGICFIFPSIGNSYPNWLICFNMFQYQCYLPIKNGDFPVRKLLIYQRVIQMFEYWIWLVVWNMTFTFPFSWEESSQLTFIFFRVGIPPTSNVIV